MIPTDREKLYAEYVGRKAEAHVPMGDTLAARADSWRAETQATWQRIAELRYSLLEITGHADFVRAFVPLGTTARDNIDGAVARAKATLERVK